MYLFYLNCVYYFEFMYLFNSCMNSCIYYFCIHVLIINCFFYVFIHYYFETSVLLYPFYDLMKFIYNPKELKLSPRKQYK